MNFHIGSEGGEIIEGQFSAMVSQQGTEVGMLLSK